MRQLELAYRLAEFAKARLYRDEAVGIDRVNKKVLCRNRPPVPYDTLSINIGSTPQMQAVPGATENVVPVKPIHQFNERWQLLLERVKSSTGKTTIAVVGGGAGGVELTLAMQFRLRNELTTLGRNPNDLSFHLFNSSKQILPTHNSRVRDTFESVLRQRGVVMHLGSEVEQVMGKTLKTNTGDTLLADEIMWVTRAGGAPWLKGTELELDDGGFIKVNDELQTLNDPNIFAAGDIACMVNHPLEKAGVFAVRQGKPLTENLRRTMVGEPLKSYHPQSTWLALISTGDKYAVASRGAISFKGAWVWRWKDAIDQRFMHKFGDLPVMSADSKPAATEPSPVKLDKEEAQQAISAIAMRCGGCGAKVGSTTLSRALSTLTPIDRSDVLIGLHSPDDAAVVRVPPGKAVVHSVDFFRAFIDDPFIFGKVAANHALGDCRLAFIVPKCWQAHCFHNFYL